MSILSVFFEMKCDITIGSPYQEAIGGGGRKSWLHVILGMQKTVAF